MDLRWLPCDSRDCSLKGGAFGSPNEPLLLSSLVSSKYSYRCKNCGKQRVITPSQFASLPPILLSSPQFAELVSRFPILGTLLVSHFND